MEVEDFHGGSPLGGDVNFDFDLLSNDKYTDTGDIQQVGILGSAS